MTRKVIFVPDDYWTNPPEENLRMTDDHTRKAPRDVVPPAPITRELILEWNDMVGATVAISVPGEVIPDSEGFPAGMTPNETYAVPLNTPLQVFRDQLDAAGLTADDVPNLTIIDRKGH